MIVPSAEREGLVSFCPQEGLWSLDIELMCKASLADTKPIRMSRVTAYLHTPRRATALRNMESSATLPVSSTADQGKTNAGNELNAG
jgi:hypothetical protein